MVRSGNLPLLFVGTIELGCLPAGETLKPLTAYELRASGTGASAPTIDGTAKAAPIAAQMPSAMRRPFRFNDPP